MPDSKLGNRFALFKRLDMKGSTYRRIGTNKAPEVLFLPPHPAGWRKYHSAMTNFENQARGDINFYGIRLIPKTCLDSIVAAWPFPALIWTVCPNLGTGRASSRFIEAFAKGQNALIVREKEQAP